MARLRIYMEINKQKYAIKYGDKIVKYGYKMPKYGQKLPFLID